MSIKHDEPVRLTRSRSAQPLSVKRQRGVSIVELMVGIAIGLIILSGVIAVVANTSFSGLENIRAVQLNQQLRGTMDVMRRELQRAGYVDPWTPGAATLAAGIDTDAMALFGTVTLGGTCSSGVCDCIVYSYDRNEDGAQGIGTGTPGTGQNTGTSELYGFRLNSNIIQMRTSGNTLSCSSGTWEGITDASVKITALGFELDGADSTVYEISGNNNGTCEAGETCLGRRKINILIDGELIADDEVTVEIRDEVKIKNDHFYVM
ncbi:MAG: hypothetical protein DRR06_12310 [Gammaproteobacteria bacterium]|nr:MAG: hypothetical protein DRR06_12310 [Gammaproteobacteria bacterium]